MLHQIKAQQFYTVLDPYQQYWVLQKIVEFKDFEWFSSSFQGRFNLQGLFKEALQIQVLFKPVGTLIFLNSLVSSFYWHIKYGAYLQPNWSNKMLLYVWSLGLD